MKTTPLLTVASPLHTEAARHTRVAARALLASAAATNPLEADSLRRCAAVNAAWADAFRAKAGA